MNILIPTDFSDYSKHAINYVYNNFKMEDVDIRLIHTIREPHSTSGVLIRLEELMKQDAQREMDQLTDRINEVYGQKPQYYLKYGHLSDWVKQYAESLKIDLIVMGTKGNTNIKSKLMGSVTESMIRVAKVPVLAVPEPQHDRKVHYVAFASETNDLPESEFVVKFVSHLNVSAPHFDILRVVKKDHDPAIPKSVSISGYQLGVKVVEDESVVDGIRGFMKSNQVDILGLFHSHKSRVDYLFNRSVTRSICNDCKVPLLVIPISR